MPALIEKDIPAITEFLKMTGCEIIPITNSNELLRFKGKETGIIYCSGNTSGRYVQRTLKVATYDTRFQKKGKKHFPRYGINKTKNRNYGRIQIFNLLKMANRVQFAIRRTTGFNDSFYGFPFGYFKIRTRVWLILLTGLVEAIPTKTTIFSKIPKGHFI